MKEIEKIITEFARRPIKPENDCGSHEDEYDRGVDNGETYLARTLAKKLGLKVKIPKDPKDSASTAFFK